RPSRSRRPTTDRKRSSFATSGSSRSSNPPRREGPRPGLLPSLAGDDMTKTNLQIYELLSGETIEYPTPEDELARFIERARAGVSDPRVSEADLTALVYGLENPLLDKIIMPGRAVVTRAVFANPVWHMLCDLIGRKRVQAGTLDLGRAEARYTMT